MTDRILRSNKIRIGDISISYYIKKGEAESDKTVIFIHGFPFNKNTWKSQLESLEDNVTGIAIDIRGHGLTTNGHGFFSIDVFAKDLKVFIDKLQLENIILVGVSMGGYIALRTYQLIPDKIKGLILSDTHSKADDNTAKQKRFDSIQAILQHGRRPFAIGFIESLFTKKNIDTGHEAIELVKSIIRRNGINSICSTLLALASRTDTTETLKEIKVPVLLIRGSEDKITPKVLMENLKNEIAESRYVEIQNAGHLPNLEAPQTFNTEMNTFISSIA